MPGKRHYRLVAAALFIIISAAITVANGFTSSCARQGTSRSNLMISSSSKMIDGYEYIHPDIAQMLTGDGMMLCNNFDPTAKQSSFPFRVDPDTLTLQLKQQGAVSMGDASIMPIDQLHHFANHCDDIVFGGNNNTLNMQKKILGLICLSQLSSTSTSSDSSSRECTSAIVVASIVSVNLLESSIRSALLKIRPQNNDHQTKGAPLLSNMIAEMSKLDTDPSLEYNKLFPLALLSPILKTLLLPTKVGGINLRNLLSHGFLSTLDRRWLSLTLVLIQTLDSCCVSVDDTKMMTKQRDVSSLTKYDLMKSEVDYGTALLSSSSRMHGLESVSCRGDFVPSSHQNLFKFTLHELGTSCLSSPNTRTIPPLTTIFITSMSSLLEHSLRLVWCRVNDRMEESIARPASYYVTLDGHGQKDKHEVMISPYLCDECTRNKLVTAVGAQTCALLTDLFASPSSSEGPNIRAAVCHGYFDDAILEELASLADWASHREQNVPLQDRNDLKDAACALVSVFDLISSNLSQGQPRMTEYRPLFSYTSMATRDLNDILGNLASLSLLMKDNDEVSGCIDKMEQQHKSTFAGISSMKVDLGGVYSLAFDLFPSLNANNTTSKWEIEDFYADHNMNIIMADCNAAQTLLADLSLASKHYLEIFEAGVGGLTSEATSTKDRRAKKSLVRLCGVSSLVLDFYCMAVYIALFAIDHHNNSSRLQLDCNLDRADVIKAVERSRMTLSTFDSYLSTNLERSIKSLTQYLQGKTFKTVLLHNQRQ
eukprot:scaffold21743_cov144-Skeletonema_dohrnii-CCMP3373.AAC.12